MAIIQLYQVRIPSRSVFERLDLIFKENLIYGRESCSRISSTLSPKQNMEDSIFHINFWENTGKFKMLEHLHGLNAYSESDKNVT